MSVYWPFYVLLLFRLQRVPHVPMLQHMNRQMYKPDDWPSCLPRDKSHAILTLAICTRQTCWFRGNWHASRVKGPRYNVIQSMMSKGSAQGMLAQATKDTGINVGTTTTHMWNSKIKYQMQSDCNPHRFIKFQTTMLLLLLVVLTGYAQLVQ